MSFTSGQVLTAAQLNNLDIDSLTVSGATSAQITFTTDGDNYKIVAEGDAQDWFYIYNITDSAYRFLIDGSGKIVLGGDTARTPLTVLRANKLGSSFTGTSEGEGLRVDQTNYTANNYVGLVEAAYQSDQSASHVRIAAQFTGSGSKLSFGTTNNYSAGVNNQAMTIDTAGKVGIGTTSPEEELHVEGDVILKDTNPGITLKDTDSTGASNGTITFRDSADTVVGRIQMNGNDDMAIQANLSGGNLYLYAMAAYRLRLVSSSLSPYYDNELDLGTSSKRYDDIFATNGTIQTSDERDKTAVAAIDYGLDFINSLRPVTYRWDDRNGYEGSRTHMGFIAQEVATALGDDAATRAVWINSPAGEYKNAETGEMEPGLERQSLRYEQLIAPAVKAIQELSARVATLEAA